MRQHMVRNAEGAADPVAPPPFHAGAAPPLGVPAAAAGLVACPKTALWSALSRFAIVGVSGVGANLSGAVRAPHGARLRGHALVRARDRDRDHGDYVWNEL